MSALVYSRAVASANKQKGFRNQRWEGAKVTDFPLFKTEVVLGKLDGLAILESTNRTLAYVIA